MQGPARAPGVDRPEPLLDDWERLPDGRYQGQVYGRSGYEDGDLITTGSVVQVTATHVTTASGTTYRLGRPNVRRRAPDAGNGKAAEDPPPAPDVPPARRPSSLDQDGRGARNGPPASRPKAAAPAASKADPATRPAKARPKPKPSAEARSLGATTAECRRALYVGDRVEVLGAGDRAGETGQVLYLGPAKFADGRQVCGLRLDRVQPGSAHDGKEAAGERHFRCSPGRGCYVLVGDVRLRGRKDSPHEAPEPYDVEKAINSLVGIQSAKQYLRSLRNRLAVGARRKAFGVTDSKPLHTLLVGSLGMDFPNVAAVLAAIFQEAAVMPRRTVHAVGRKDLVAMGSEATVKLCDEAVAQAQGGVLLILDAGGLVTAREKDDFYGTIALNRVLAAVDGPGEPAAFVVVLAVRREGLAALFQASPMLAGLGAAEVDLSEYTLPETATLLRDAVAVARFDLHPDLTDPRLAELLAPPLGRCPPDRRGVELVRRLVEEAIGRQTDRVSALPTLSLSRESLLQLRAADFEPPPTQGGAPAERILARLDEVVGLEAVKAHVHALLAQLQIEQDRRTAGLPMPPTRSTTLHMVFSGNPGTGKTTIARIISEVLQAMSILRCGHCVETDRSDLVAGYVGQTALKVHEVVQKALGGVLFIDEAYTLAARDDRDPFGREALDTLMKLVEDHRDDLVVILAGYPQEMEHFLSHNPGIRSRFPTVIVFEDYTVAELLAIADRFLARAHLDLDPDAQGALREQCARIASSGARERGNGRAVRNVMERAVRRHALRLMHLRRAEQATGSPRELSTLTADDFALDP